MASRGQGRGVADDPIIFTLCPLPSNVTFHHLLNDRSVSLGESPSPAGNTDKMHLYFQLRPHRLNINFKGKNRVLKEATPWSGIGQIQEAKSCKRLLQRT